MWGSRPTRIYSEKVRKLSMCAHLINIWAMVMCCFVVLFVRYFFAARHTNDFDCATHQMTIHDAFILDCMFGRFRPFHIMHNGATKEKQNIVRAKKILSKFIVCTFSWDGDSFSVEILLCMCCISIWNCWLLFFALVFFCFISHNYAANELDYRPRRFDCTCIYYKYMPHYLHRYYSKKKLFTIRTTAFIKMALNQWSTM